MSAPQTPPGRSSSLAYVIAATTISVVVTGCATALTLAGKGIGDLLAVVAVAVVPVLGLLGAQISSKLDQVREQGNGNIAALRDTVIRLAEQSHPAPPPMASAPPAPTPTVVLPVSVVPVAPGIHTVETAHEYATASHP